MDRLPTTITAAHLHLWALARLSAGWDGHDAPPPSAMACERAHQVVSVAASRGFTPSQVVPDVEGGVALYWYGEERTAGGGHRLAASVSIDNDGDLFASMVDRVTQHVETWGALVDDLDAVLDRLMNFTAQGAVRAAS
ncbi:MAG: hypothetical protein Q8S73_00240 [Deltaproteobacteria bacterium]|nr:hypothetical protein [Deltaproteobacteria bacterium]